ncbi:hypothetical protein GGF46_002545 [Coemansia sp. RSA 552]|nr:hypothetical protein GGF46_002545 [Coemansia sp. RSA 552]
MSLSLVPQYDSASDASDSEPEAAPAQGKRVRIVVDLPQPRAAKRKTLEAEEPDATRHTTAQPSSGGSMFSELSSMLPAPKNSIQKPQRSTPEPPARADSSQPALIPHSLSARRRLDSKGKAAATDKPDPELPFFTINAPEPEPGPEPDGAHISPDQRRVGGEPGEPTASTIDGAPSQLDLIYDPTSGYYYDQTSGVYYHYDQVSSSYVDARAYFNSVDQSPPSPADNHRDLEALIGRGELRRGEAHALHAMASVSRSAQLADAGYSEATAAAELTARHAAAAQRQKTMRHIASSEVDRQKKQKHNIMYLALQAQEQEAQIKDASANRRQARKAARTRYGI